MAKYVSKDRTMIVGVHSLKPIKRQDGRKRPLQDILISRKDVLELELTTNFYDFREDPGKHLADPNIQVAHQFQGLKALGRTSTWYFLIENKLYRRLSYTDLGIKGKRRGLCNQKQNRPVYYVVEMSTTALDDIKAELKKTKSNI